HIQLIIPIEHYSPHGIAKSYPNSATPLCLLLFPNQRPKSLRLFSQIYSELPAAINAYKQRMGIEEMFRDCKTVGYDLEGTSLKGDRLINMILLMTLAYTWAIFQGTLTEEKAGTKICISSQRTQEKISQTEYIWCWIRWRKVG
ncbi:hypothetical protein QUB05_27850, partial [Microcoleus sp. F10-C6]